MVATDENSKNTSEPSVYGKTKYEQEKMVMLSEKLLGIPSVAFRYQNVYDLDSHY